MKFKTKLIAATLALVMVALTAAPALARDENENERSITASTSIKVNLNKGEDEHENERGGRSDEIKVNGQIKSIKKAVREIDRRIEGLNKLITNLQSMKKVSTTTKTTLTATVHAQITSLTALKSQLTATSTATTTLAANIQSITQAYRIYAMVIPQVQILATADKVLTTSDTLTTLSAKLQAKITEAQATGSTTSANGSSTSSAIADLNAKIADAKVQANAAITLVSGLKADNGDEAVLQANKKALKDAREKIRIGERDLKDAAKDAKNIVKLLKKMNINTSVTATSTAKVRGERENEQD
jgi:hypothetical protein